MTRKAIGRSRTIQIKSYVTGIEAHRDQQRRGSADFFQISRREFGVVRSGADPAARRADDYLNKLA